MIRTLNFAFIAITSLVCLGVYRTAEHARRAREDQRCRYVLPFDWWSLTFRSSLRGAKRRSNPVLRWRQRWIASLRSQ